MDISELKGVTLLLLLLGVQAWSSKAADVNSTQLCKECSCTTEHGLFTVSCVELSLKSFINVARLPEGTIELDLSRNDITVLDQLEPIDGLKSLSISFNKILSVEPNAFDKYIFLKSLDLSNNDISKIVVEVFNGLDNLKVLNLSRNLLRSLPDNIFYNLPMLKELHLSGNPLHMLRYELFRQSETLKVLDISNTGLDHLENNLFHSLIDLETLDISGNLMEEVPKKALASAPKLKHLKMNHNAIALLSEGDFKRMAYLETLDISHTDSLTTIETGAFSGLKSLRVLRITSNQNLQTLNFGAFEGLYAPQNRSWTLKELYLRQNGFKTVDSPSTSLCHIEVLDLQQNPWACDCNMQWITRCVIRVELTRDMTCAQPKFMHGKILSDLSEEDFVCISLTMLEHQQKVLRIVVITSAIVGVFLVGLIIALVIKRRQIIEWWSYRKRGSGAVYYVKADANPNELLEAQ